MWQINALGRGRERPREKDRETDRQTNRQNKTEPAKETGFSQRLKHRESIK